MIIGDVERDPVSKSIYDYRYLVDEWNSLTNAEMTNGVIDHMFDLYASIKVHKVLYATDIDFMNELKINSDRYVLNKYKFINLGK